MSVLWLPMVGCALDPISEVRIEGGTPEAVAAVRAGLEAFDARIGRDRLSLRRIEFTSFEDGALGKFSENRDLVLLSEGLTVDEIPAILRHELCHALDFAEDLAEDPGGPWDTVAAALQSESTIDRYDAEPRFLRAEALAITCMTGAEVAGILAEPCDGDPSWMDDAYGWLLDRVWTGTRPPPPFVTEPARAWTPDISVIGHLDVEASVEPYVVWVLVGTGTPGAPVEVQTFFDVRSGPLDWPEGSVALDSSSSPGDGDGVLPGAFGSITNLPDGSAAAVLVITHHGLAESATRLVWTDGEEWRAVDGGGCGYQTLVPSGDSAWTWWVDGPEVWWRRVGP